MLADSMRRSVFIIIAALVIMISCTEKKTNLNKEDIVISSNDSVNSCLNSEFHLCVSEYIQKTKGFFCGYPVYYPVYFFTKENIDFFTIWTDFSSPKASMEYYNPLSNFKYSSLKIDESDVVIIENDTYNNKQLYQCCEFLIKKDSIPKHENYVIYDGRIYIETYSYSLQNGKYVLKKLDSPITDILGELPEMFW